MPSLRRSTSSPAVRASPYPTSLSASSSAHAPGASRPRRTASETTSRRVLADIEWWRVLGGQHLEEPGSYHDQEQDPRFGQDETLAGGGSLHQDQLHYADVGSTQPPTPANFMAIMDLSTEETALMSPFAALSISAIAPSTPIRTRHGRESSSSSTESTPERPRHRDVWPESTEELPTFPELRPTLLNGMRSFSFAGFPSPHSPTDDRFGDVVFL